MRMLMLVMMVLTRTRLGEDSQVSPNQSVAEGSASAIMSHTKRRRKNNTKARDIEHVPQQSAIVEPAVLEPAIVEPAVSAEQPSDPPKRRGPNINKSISQTLKNLPRGSKIPLTMDKDTKNFVGTSATQFSTECGIVIRNVCPMNFHTWDSVPEDVKTLMYEKLGGKFELLRADSVFMEYVNTRLHAQWKRTRGVLSQHWKKNEGKTNPRKARSNMKPDCRSEEDWNHLCDYWESEKTRKYSDQMEINRSKQVNISRGGSRSISNLVFQMTTPETQMTPSPIEVYYKLHYNAKKQGWLNEHSKSEYESIIAHKNTAKDKLKSEGTTITVEMERNLEKEAIKSVCGKTKTIQSGWEVGVGPVLQKKDRWMKSRVETAQGEAETMESNEDLKNQVNALKEQLKQSNEKRDRMSDFLLTKFPDFESIISPSVTNDAQGSDGLSGDSYNTT